MLEIFLLLRKTENFCLLLLVAFASSGHPECIHRERGYRPASWVYHLQSPNTVQQKSDGLCDCGRK